LGLAGGSRSVPIGWVIQLLLESLSFLEISTVAVVRQHLPTTQSATFGQSLDRGRFHCSKSLHDRGSMGLVLLALFLQRKEFGDGSGIGVKETDDLPRRFMPAIAIADEFEVTNV